MYSGVEGGDEDDDTRVNRNLFTRVKECDVYGYCPVARYPDITLIASGGVGSLVDIQALEEVGVSAVIVGKAFYEKFKM